MQNNKIIKINIEPKGKARPRFTKSGIAYTDSKSKKYETELSNEIKKAWDSEPLDLPVFLEIVAVFALPKSQHRKKPVGQQFHCKKPDVDNIAKMICDAGNEIIWKDDKLIFMFSILKLIGAQGVQPYIQLSINW